jgi:hypothetical protein
MRGTLLEAARQPSWKFLSRTVSPSSGFDYSFNPDQRRLWQVLRSGSFAPVEWLLHF